MIKLKILFITFLIVLKMLFIIYPSLVISITIIDSKLRDKGESIFIPMWFETTTHKYNNWAEEYINTKQAKKAKINDVASTEWPMFGSVFYLKTVQALQEKKLIDIDQKHIQQAVKNASTIIVSPDTATWVKKKWKKHYIKTGKSYLENENVFYRMLLIMGLSSYQQITKDIQYSTLMEEQYLTLYHELMDARYYLKDDYPNECYPVDVLWALASIENANNISRNPLDISPLKNALLNTFNTVIKSKTGLPAFQVDSNTGKIIQEARGSGISGMLLHTSYLNIDYALLWYKAYEKYFLKQSSWFIGFREFPQDTPSFMDADTGPIINGYGSVASLFAIGASKTIGRLDHTVPLSIEAITYALPTPFGFLLPSIVGKLTVDSWVLGDVAFLYSMTRTIHTDNIIPFEGSIPWSIWIILSSLWILGILLTWIEIRWLKWLLFQHKYYKTKKGKINAN